MWQLKVIIYPGSFIRLALLTVGRQCWLWLYCRTSVYPPTHFQRNQSPIYHRGLLVSTLGQSAWDRWWKTSNQSAYLFPVNIMWPISRTSLQFYVSLTRLKAGQAWEPSQEHNPLSDYGAHCTEMYYCIYWRSSNTELCLRRLVAGFCQRKPGFHPEPAHVGLLMNKVALRQVPVQVFRFPAVSIVPSVLHRFRFIRLLLAIQSREL